MGVICVLYLVFGSLCYMFFGADTNDVILVNIASTSGLVAAIKTLLAVALLFQYPVSLFPATAILEEQVFTQSRSSGHIQDPPCSYSPVSVTRHMCSCCDAHRAPSLARR
jgi:amino acid permease